MQLSIPARKTLRGVAGRTANALLGFMDYVRSTPLRVGTLATVAAFNTTNYRTDAYARNILPEPLDWPDHIGNVTPSLIIGALASACVVRVAERVTPNADPQIVRCAMMAGALAAGAAANYAVESGGMETVIGDSAMNFIFEGRTSNDAVDAAYGILAAGAGSAAIKTSLEPLIPTRPE